MATIPPLSLSNLVDISVTVSPAAATANSLNQGLFIGNSSVIPAYGANSRLRQYSAQTFTSAMLTDGFTVNSPEYIGLQTYFDQNPQAQFGWAGVQETTAIATLIIDAAGTGWAVGDLFSVTQSGANNFIGRVTAEAGGIPSAIEIVQQGQGFSVATGLPTVAISPSTGTGLTVTITAIGETLLQAAVACRNTNSTWYGLSVYNPVDADNLALAEWADPLWQTTRYYAWSADVAIANGTAGNLALQLQALKLRTIGVYSTTQSGLFPNNIYAAAALMGVEMGGNTGLPSSFFTDAHKQLVGIAPEPVSQTQYGNIKNANFNVYGNFQPYQLLEPGFASNGDPSYLWLYLAVLVSQMQINLVNVLQSLPVVPQNNAGQHFLLQAADTSCAYVAAIGFLATGTWQGAAVLNGLSTGQSLPLGYLNQSPSYATQSQGDRDAGKAVPILCAITTAGAVQSLLVGIYAEI